jgi:tRNA pseudouridine55 synthase
VPVYAVCKPLHVTSHDAVASARRQLGTKKVGHAGTLDPLASGVLLILVGSGTKLSAYLTGHRKRYLAWVALGASTPTLDAEGPVLETAPASHLTADDVRDAAASFLDVTSQVPPKFSAIKRGGRAAYKDARAGDTDDDMPTRPCGYIGVTLLAFGPPGGLPTRFNLQDGRVVPNAAGAFTPPRPPDLTAGPLALVSLEVKAGTYIRSFARDLGVKLGVPAHLAGLLRTASGRVTLNDTVPLDGLADATPLQDADALHLPRVPLRAHEAARVRQGQRLPLERIVETDATLEGGGAFMLLDETGALAAIARVLDGRLTYDRVISR